MRQAKIKRFNALDYTGTEAINTICTNLSFSGRDCKRIAFTSFMPGAGKTYMCLNILHNMAKRGKRVLMIDAEEGITEQDAKIAGIAHDRGRGMIIAVNKWDAIEKDNHSVKKFTNEIRNTLSFMPYAEILFISAKTGQRIPKLFDALETVIQNHSLRIATGVVNEILMEAVAMQQPPSDKGRRLKIYYMTQVSVKPPTFVVFVNDKRLMHFSYTRYLENKIREAFGFAGTPLRFLIRERSKK